jgi:hypothetical protein
MKLPNYENSPLTFSLLVGILSSASFSQYRQCISLPRVLVSNHLRLFIFTELMCMKVLPRSLIAKALIQVGSVVEETLLEQDFTTEQFDFTASPFH